MSTMTVYVRCLALATTGIGHLKFDTGTGCISPIHHQHDHHNMQLLWLEPFCMQQRLHQTHHSNVGIHHVAMCVPKSICRHGWQDQ